MYWPQNELLGYQLLRYHYRVILYYFDVGILALLLSRSHKHQRELFSNLRNVAQLKKEIHSHICPATTGTTIHEHCHFHQ